MTKRLRIAVAGTGYFSTFHFDAWSRCPEVEIVGVSGLDRDAVKLVAEQHNIGNTFDDVAAMLDHTKPDLLDIITPPPTHNELIGLAAARSTNVVCQKPFCGTFADAKTAVEVGESAGIDVTVHENFRFQPWYVAMQEQLASGRLGQVYRAHFRLRPGDGQGPDAYLERQPYFQKMDRFLVHETAIHHVDVARYFFGNPETVSADLAKLNPVIAGEDSAIITLGFKNGLRAVIDGNRLSDHRAENCRRTMGELLIEGQQGTLSLNGDGEIFFRAHGSKVEERIPFNWNDHGFGGDCVYQFTRHVVDHYVTNTPLSNSARDYLTNLEIEEAIYESGADGCRRSL